MRKCKTTTATEMKLRPQREYDREQYRRHREDNQLYVKRHGRYLPTSDPWAYEGLREGSWLIIVQPGCTSIRECVWPANAEVEAAIRTAEDAMIKAMQEALKLKPQQPARNSPKWQRAWKRFAAEVGDELAPTTLWRASVRDAVQAGLAAMRPHVEVN